MKKTLVIICILVCDFCINKALILSQILSIFVALFMTYTILTKFSKTDVNAIKNKSDFDEERIQTLTDMLTFEFLLFVSLTIMIFDIFSKIC